MPVVSGIVDPDEILIPELVPRQVETNQCVYLLPSYHIPTHQQKLVDKKETWILDAGKMLVVECSVLCLCAGFSFLFSLLGKGLV